MPGSSGSVLPATMYGSSCVSSPMPWPVRCTNHWPYPAAVISSRAVASTASHEVPGRTASTRARLGVEEDSEVVEEVLRGVANRVGAGAVGAVAVGRGSTDVDDDGIADLDNAFADVMVGACGVRAGPHDDEVSADVTLVEDRLTDVFGDLGLASTGAQELAHPLVHPIDRGAGSPQRVDLGRRLPHP